MNIERTNRTAWIGLGVVLLLALAALSAFGGGMFGHAPGLGYGDRPMMGVGPWFWGFGLIGLLIRVAIWGAIIMFALRFFRRASGRWDTDGYHRSEQSSLEILRRRYAAGEISREQFEEMRRTLDPSTTAQ